VLILSAVLRLFHLAGRADESHFFG